MTPHSISKIIKLGTSIRFLVDLPYRIQVPGEKVHWSDNKVIEGLQTVIDLIPEVGLETIVTAKPYKQLQKLRAYAELRKDLYLEPADVKQFEFMHDLRRVVLAAGNLLVLYELSENDFVSLNRLTKGEAMLVVSDSLDSKVLTDFKSKDLVGVKGNNSATGWWPDELSLSHVQHMPISVWVYLAMCFATVFVVGFSLSTNQWFLKFLSKFI